MVWLIISYIFSILVVFCVIQLRKICYKKFSNLKISSHGIYFYSKLRHRLKIGDASIMQVGTNVYLKQKNKFIILKNVKSIHKKAEFLYFTAIGKCELCFFCKRLSKYFNIKLTSNQFDISSLREKALHSIVDNIFFLNEAEDLKKYLKVLNEVLKIKITKKRLSVSQNQFKLPFKLEYVANNTKKIINVNNLQLKKPL